MPCWTTPTPVFASLSKNKNKHLLFSQPHTLAWLKTEIDRTQDQISVTAFIDFVPARGLGKTRFLELSAWAKSGIERYWSRQIEMDGHRPRVAVRVVPRRIRALKIRLAVNNASCYARSHNTGILCACVKLNAGFFNDEAEARASFELTAAHEFGHSILYAAGGLRHSWGHKGTASILFQCTHKDAPAYPQHGEIDLMCYYNAPAVDLQARVQRSCASAGDVEALVRLGMQKE